MEPWKKMYYSLNVLPFTSTQFLLLFIYLFWGGVMDSYVCVCGGGGCQAESTA